MEYLHGIDRLPLADGLLKNKRLGLITNPSGLDSSLRSTVGLLAERYTLARLYAPEHGIYGEKQAGELFHDEIDEKTGVRVRSLFDGHDDLTLDGIDCLVYDIQDIGLRFYTYIYAMTEGMRAASNAGIPFVVLDRLDPLGLSVTGGSYLDARFASGVGRFPLPGRYALTAGELAGLLNERERIGCELHVIPCAGLDRRQDILSLGLPFIQPSPNLPTMNSVYCYVGTVLFEGTNLSEGRGTTRPFECFGAPWLDTDELMTFIKNEHFEGALFRPLYFRPTFSKYAGETCRGIEILLTDVKRFDAFRFALSVIDHIRHTNPNFRFPGEKTFFIDHLLGSDALRDEHFAVDAFLASEREKTEAFRRYAKDWHLY